MSIDVNDKLRLSNGHEFWAKWREYRNHRVTPQFAKLKDGYHEDFCSLVFGEDRNNGRFASTVAHALHLTQAMEMAARLAADPSLDKDEAMIMLFDWAFSALHSTGDDVVVFDLMNDYHCAPTPIADGNMYKGNRGEMPDYSAIGNPVTAGEDAATKMEEAIEEAMPDEVAKLLAAGYKPSKELLESARDWITTREGHEAESVKDAKRVADVIEDALRKEA